MRKPVFAYAKPKAQMSYRAGHQRFWFRYINSTIPLLPKSEISSLLPSSVAVQPCFNKWDLVGNPEDMFSCDAAR